MSKLDTIDTTVFRAGAHSKVYSFGALGNGFDFLFFVFGCFLNSAAYMSVMPTVAALIFFSINLVALFLPKLGGRYERQIFIRTFSIYWVCAGVAAVYANYLGDVSQLKSDANSFFELASRSSGALSLQDLRTISEGALAISLWASVYDAFAWLGFERARFIGILTNVSIVAFVGVITLKITRNVYGEDPYRFRRLILLFSTCGLFWLFASIHLRDAMVLLAVTAIAYAWTAFLAKPDEGLRFLMLLTASVFGGLFLGYLRGDFAFVPVAMTIAGTAALLLGRNIEKTDRRIGYLLALAGLLISVIMTVIFGQEALQVFTRGTQGYLSLATDQNARNSLGMALIVNQPFPVRIMLGSLILFLFPIPIWSGIQLESAYVLFKSFNALFFYFVIPLVALGMHMLWQRKYMRAPNLLFFVFLSVGFTAVIAGTSLETRHFGAFFPGLFVVALLPDLSNPKSFGRYKRLLIIFLGLMCFVHALWAVLKFL